MSASSNERAKSASPKRTHSAIGLDLAQREMDAAVEASSMREDGVFDLARILESVRETAYCWDFASDRMIWAENAEY